MKFLKIKLIVALLIANCLLQGIDVSGNQSGEWIPENNPYNVIGYIVVPSQEVLTIHPGVEVLFTGMFGINVYGQIIAAGTETDSISFSGAAQTEWDQIRLDNSEAEHYFSYCRIRDAYRGIASVDSPVEIDGCHFLNNENGIFIGAIGNPDPPAILINNCLIENSLNHGIFILENSATIVENCDICFSA
ncbi:MAG: hypothetical protein JW996_04910, partial [Candidatus Cloacimonetes bacterium]|nr:hypothetical protein [Candidatus Cloacimonadota bacterium]